jgi:AcrR family transcriptional regulator
VPSNRPRGRRPGNADTRAEIIAAALHLFSTDGYDRVSLRQIAREAGVDPALIHHYFENKAELFTLAVIAVPVEDAAEAVQRILAAPREKIGERAVDVVMATFERPGASQRFIALLRAAMNTTAPTNPLSEFLAREILAKVAGALGHKDAARRGQLAMVLFVGYVMSRDIMGFPALVKQRRSEMVSELGKAMQAFLVDPW